VFRPFEEKCEVGEGRWVANIGLEGWVRWGEREKKKRKRKKEEDKKKEHQKMKKQQTNIKTKINIRIKWRGHRYRICAYHYSERGESSHYHTQPRAHKQKHIPIKEEVEELEWFCEVESVVDGVEVGVGGGEGARADEAEEMKEKNKWDGIVLDVSADEEREGNEKKPIQMEENDKENSD
jgi:hypothetical protein